MKIGMIQVKHVRLVLNWQHSFGIKINQIERRSFTLICGCRADNEIHTNWLALENISSDLILLLMLMRIHAPSNNGLVFIINSV